MAARAVDDLVTRREAIRRVSALLGGAALIGQSAWLAGCATGQRQLFSDIDVALLDEVADTILPDTKTPGAKAAEVRAFIARWCRAPLRFPRQPSSRRTRDARTCESRRQSGRGFMASSPAQRLAFARAARPRGHRMVRDPIGRSARTIFRMIKELTLLGIPRRRSAVRRRNVTFETPGRFEPCVTSAPVTSRRRHTPDATCSAAEHTRRRLIRPAAHYDASVAR